jgi:hypothetical protein
VGTPHNPWERTARLLSEATGISTENVASVKGLSSYESTPVIPITDRGGNFCFQLNRVATVQSTYKKASALERKSMFELNTLFEILSSRWQP